VIREYADGMFDADWTRGPGLSPGFKSFGEALDWLRAYREELAEPDRRIYGGA
jgi:hypothetical protein